MFRHLTSAGPFTSSENAESFNKDNPTADKFSRLDELETFRSKKDGKLHFKLCYPGKLGENRKKSNI